VVGERRGSGWTLACLLAACDLGSEGPAAPGSPSAVAAARAGDLAVIAAGVRDEARGLQAACDPEQVAAGAPPPDPALLAERVERISTGVAEAERALGEIDGLARPAGLSAP